MYPYTKFWVPTSHNIHILFGLDLSRTVASGQCHRDENSRWHTVANRYIQIPNLRVLCHKIKKICSVHDFYTNEARGQGHIYLKVVRYNLNIKMHQHTKFEIVTSINVADLFKALIV